MNLTTATKRVAISPLFLRCCCFSYRKKKKHACPSVILHSFALRIFIFFSASIFIFYLYMLLTNTNIRKL